MTTNKDTSTRFKISLEEIGRKEGLDHIW